MDKRVDVQKVVNTILHICNENNLDMNNLRLQKTLYYIQGESLSVNNRMLFREEIVSWSYGPVVYDVWKKYKKYGKYNIVLEDEDNLIADKQTLDLITKVLFKLSTIDVWELVEKTHKEIPWMTLKWSGGVMTEELLRKQFN